MRPYYYIHRDGGFPPSVKHSSLDLAHKESIRLSNQHPGEAFEILVCIGITRTTRPDTFWMDGVTPHGCETDLN